jgi:hypothetical protein
MHVCHNKFISNEIRYENGKERVYRTCEASRDIGLEKTVDKAKYMFMSHSKSGQNQNIRIANESFDNVAKFKYFVTSLTDKKDFHNRP